MSSHELVVLMAIFGPIAIPRYAKEEFPSRQAIKLHDRIAKSLSALVSVAQSGISYDRERKDIKRKHDLFREFLLGALANIYEETFKKNASARREGEWPIFLSRVLSILEGKETTPDAAYEALLKVNERLRLKEQFLTSRKQRQTPLSSAA